MTRRAIKTSSYVMMPLMAGLAACATPLVRLLLKEQWLPCVPFMQIFCAIYAFYPLHTANLNAIKAMGRSDIFLKLELVKKAVETSVLLYTLHYGVLAMALGQLVCDILAQLINAWPNKKLLNYPYWTQLRDLLPCLLLSLAMAGCVLAVQLLGLSDLLTLLIQVPLGVAIYVLGSVLLKLDSFEYILSIAKKMLQKRKAEPTV
jgi:O-antigen/teichoic acid export membrane protein